MRWAAARRRHPPPKDPAQTVERLAPGFPARAGETELAITWVGHSTFLVQIGGLNVLTDPIWSGRASPVAWAGPKRVIEPGVAFEKLPAIDAVVLSHDHYDHLDRRTICALVQRAPDAHWLAPLGLAELLLDWGASDVTELDWWNGTALGEVRATAVPARHFSGRSMHDRGARLWCGWALAAATKRVLFAGDTAAHPEFSRIGRELGPFDATLLPIASYAPRWFMEGVHVTPEEAVEAYAATNAGASKGVFAAMHFGTFRLADDPLAEAPMRLRRAWSTEAPIGHDLWIPRPGETRRL